MLAQEQHPFVSDESFNENLEKMEILETDHLKLNEINDEARTKSTKISLIVMAAISLLFMAGTGGIEDDTQEKLVYKIS